MVDTSIWSLALRRKPEKVNPEAVALKMIIERGEDIYLIGIILQEVLQGIKNPKDFRILKDYFEVFPLIELIREDYIKASELKNHLMKKGKQISTIDALIASVSISNDCYLFTTDRDFEYIAQYSNLRLYKYQ
ncbi:MAG: PIN domain-containing protein [Nitrospirae bacterium]|nr:PIN domain-containing protein [Nitrospirota bacterium]